MFWENLYNKWDGGLFLNAFPTDSYAILHNINSECQLDNTI